MQIHLVVFSLSRQINKQMYAKTINPLCASNKVFVIYQTQKGGLTLTPLRTPLLQKECLFKKALKHQTENIREMPLKF